MAEAIGLAEWIVGVARAGVSVVSTLTKFGISPQGSDYNINSLAGRVSLTASVISDIATTVEQNASGFKKEEFWRTWRKILLSCEDSYGKLEKALLKAKRSNLSNYKNDSGEVSVWGKLVWALGGEIEMQDLKTSLERCCQQVVMMQQAVQMSVLSLIARRQQLSSDEIDDQRALKSKLQWLLLALSEAGLLATGSIKGKSAIVIDEDPTEPPKYSSPIESPAGELPKEFNSTGKVRNIASPFGGLDGAGDGTTSSAAHAVVPQSIRRIRSPEFAHKTPSRSHSAKNNKQPRHKDYFFEAYYLIPRSVSRVQLRGQIQLIKPLADEYMTICLDSKQDYHDDPNVRYALRKAKRARDSVTNSIVNSFPRTVQDAALSLANYKKKHANGMLWSLVEGVELRCLEDSMFRKPSTKSGYLIVFRGSCPTQGTKPGPSLAESDVPGLASRGESTPPSSPPLPPILKTSGASVSPLSSRRVSFEKGRTERTLKHRKASRNPLVVQSRTIETQGKTVVNEIKSEAQDDSSRAPRLFSLRSLSDKELQKERKGGGRLRIIHREVQAKPRESWSKILPATDNDTVSGDLANLGMVFEDQTLDRSQRLDRSDIKLGREQDSGLGHCAAKGDREGSKGWDSVSEEPAHIKVAVKDPIILKLAPQSALGSDGDHIEESPEQKSVPASEIRPSSMAKSGRNDKPKPKVEFDNAALLKSGRQATRPLPGPVHYSIRPRSMTLSTYPSTAPMSPPPTAVQRPQSQDSGSSFKADLSSMTRPLSQRFASRSPSFSSPSTEYSPQPLSGQGSAAQGLPISNSPFYSYNTPAPYTMVPPQSPTWTAKSAPAHKPSLPQSSFAYIAREDEVRTRRDSDPPTSSPSSLDETDRRKRIQERLNETQVSIKGREQDDQSKSRSRQQATSIAKAGTSSAVATGAVKHSRNRSHRRSGEHSSRFKNDTEPVVSRLARTAVADLHERRNSKEQEDREVLVPSPDRENSKIYRTPSVELAAPAPAIKEDVDDVAASGRLARQSPPQPQLATPKESNRDRERDGEESDSASDSELSISESSSAASGDEDSTLVEDHKDAENEELHLTQCEAEAMMMKFLATFATV